MDVNWQPYIIDFTAPANLDYIVITPGCALNCAEYIYIDNIYFSLTVPLALFTSPNHICPGTCTDFVNLSQNATTYQWTFTGANPSVSVDANPTNICYNSPGNYAVTLIASNSISSDTLTLNNYITVYPYPPAQGILQSGDTLFANQGAVSYQWYQGGNLIPGATGYFYVATGSGDFNVVATDANGCEVEAAIFDVVAGLTPTLSKGEGVTAAPNPVIDKLIIQLSEFKNETAIDVSIYNVLGEKIYAVADCRLSPDGYRDVNCLLFPSGMYYLEVRSNSKTFRTKFIKQ